MTEEIIRIKKITLVENRQLAEENAKLKEKLEQIKNAILYYRETDYFALCKFSLKIIEGAEDEYTSL